MHKWLTFSVIALLGSTTWPIPGALLLLLPLASVYALFEGALFLWKLRQTLLQFNSTYPGYSGRERREVKRLEFERDKGRTA